MAAPSEVQEILLIDDDEGNLTLFSEMLTESGYRVRVARSGEEGLRSAREAPPGLILLDITMPGMDGFEVCRALKADPALATLPVIFTSGREEMVDKARAFALGAADYLQRPFRLGELALRVQHQFGLVALQAQLQEKNRNLQVALEESKILNRELVRINERLRLSEELHGHFLATMRSVINNPLTAIIGLSEQIHHGAVPLEQARHLAALISGEAFYLDFQIRNIFVAADLEGGTCAPRISQVDVGSILRDVTTSFRQVAASKGLILRLPGEEAGPLAFATDPGMMWTILANLLANALAFSPQGGEVRVLARVHAGVLTLEIQDEGQGILEEDQVQIFDRFRRLAEGTTSDHQGPGLGLAITRALLDLLGGTITVASTPGQGARFTCTFPEGQVLDEATTASFEGNLFIFDAPQEF